MDEAIVNFLNKGPAHPTRASHRTAAKKYAAFLLANKDSHEEKKMVKSITRLLFKRIEIFSYHMLGRVLLESLFSQMYPCTQACDLQFSR